MPQEENNKDDTYKSLLKNNDELISRIKTLEKRCDDICKFNEELLSRRNSDNNDDKKDSNLKERWRKYLDE